MKLWVILSIATSLLGLLLRIPHWAKNDQTVAARIASSTIVALTVAWAAYGLTLVLAR